MTAIARLTARITLAVENSVRDRGLVAEHGLSWWVEWGERVVLFDCGQGAALGANAPRLGLDLSRTRDLVFSHGHFDHSGGLPSVLASGARPRLLAHPSALGKRYSLRRGADATEVGVPASTRAALESHALELTPVTRPTEIAPGLFVTGEVPRLQPWEQEDSPFFLDAAGSRADPLCDDQALYFKTAEGLVVLLGCAHAGVVSTLEYVQDLAGEKRLRLVAGGMHLEHASSRRLDRTLQALSTMAIASLAPLHCTGFAAQCLLRTFLPERYAIGSVGSRWSFEALGAAESPGPDRRAPPSPRGAG